MIELQRGKYLPHLGHKKALREQHNFTNLLQVRNNYYNRSEQGLDTLRQLSAASITRVHCDEDAHTIIHGDLNTFKLTKKTQFKFYAAQVTTTIT